MDAEKFRNTRRALGLTEVGFGSAFGVSRRTVQNWAKKGPPPYIAHLLELALVLQIPVRSPNAGFDEILEELTPALDAVLKSATAADWDRQAVLVAIEHWAREKGLSAR